LDLDGGGNGFHDFDWEKGFTVSFGAIRVRRRSVKNLCNLDWLF